MFRSLRNDNKIFLRAGSRQNGFFADFYFWAAGFFRGFCRRIFSPHFCGKKCPEKSSRKIPGKILQNLYYKNPPKFILQKSSNTFLQIAQGNFSKIKLALFYCRGRFPREKQRFGRFSSLPPSPPPLKDRKFYFYCRLAASEVLNDFWSSSSACPRVFQSVNVLSEDAMGGWKKEGGGKPHEWHPSQKWVLDPPSYGTFSTPLKCQCSVFPVQKSMTEQTRSSFGGVQKFSGERVLWYVLLPPYVLHPPISRPNFGGLFHVCRRVPWGKLFKVPAQEPKNLLTPLFSLVSDAFFLLTVGSFLLTVELFIRKIRAPIKIKSALPPPQNPPPKRGILRTWFFLQKERTFSRCP